MQPMSSIVQKQVQNLCRDLKIKNNDDMKKMLPFLLVVLCLFRPGPAGAQKNGQALIDSLLAALKTAKEDTGKVCILNNLSLKYSDIAAYEDSKKYADNALALSEKINFKRGIAYALENRGFYYIMLADYSKARHELLAALRIYKDLGNKKGIANVHSELGYISNNQGNYPEALKEYYASLRVSEEIGDEYLISSTHINIGGCYFSQGVYPEALKEYSAALKISEKLGDKMGVANVLGSIGGIYADQGKYSEGIKEQMASLKIYEELGVKQEIATQHNNLAISYMDLNNFSEALNHLFSALKTSEEIGDKRGIAVAYLNIGNLKRKMKNPGEAKDWEEKALKISKEIGDKRIIQEAYENIYHVDSSFGNFKGAFENHKLFITYRDSLFNEETTKKNVQEKMQYEFEKKEAATKAVADAELQKQKLVRNGFIGGFAVVLLFAGVFLRQRNKTRKEKKRAEDEKQRSKALLLNILPEDVAKELEETGGSKAKAYTMVTVMFTDFKDFTKVSEKVSAEMLVQEIHHCFSAFDNILQQYRIEKIKTIGDAYMCASGLPVSNYTHASDMIHCAFEIRKFMLERKKEKELKEEIPFELRLGIHTGPVVAGIVGIKKYAYDIWGDTVNLASRMEQNSEAGKINISGTTYELVKDKFKCEHRGKISAKNKGEIDMYFVEP
jgi:adenylate cyclase